MPVRIYLQLNTLSFSLTDIFFTSDWRPREMFAGWNGELPSFLYLIRF